MVEDMADLLRTLPPWAPWAIAVALLLGLAWLIHSLRAGFGRQLDPQRLFSSVQKAEGRQRCDNRCEHKLPLWFRCRGRADHGDHIFPHSRGGATAMSNLQFLCQPHNLSKSARVPSATYIWRLQRRRRKYFPPSANRRVEWRLGRATNGGVQVLQNRPAARF